MQSGVINPDECPRVESPSSVSEIVVHSGESKQIAVRAVNFKVCLVFNTNFYMIAKNPTVVWLYGEDFTFRLKLQLIVHLKLKHRIQKSFLGNLSNNYFRGKCLKLPIVIGLIE